MSRWARQCCSRSTARRRAACGARAGYRRRDQGREPFRHLLGCGRAGTHHRRGGDVSAGHLLSAATCRHPRAVEIQCCNGAYTPEEREIWERLARSVTPLAGRKAALPSANLPASLPDGAFAPAASRGLSAALPASSVAPPAPRRTPQPVLDSSWERRIGNGTLAPDATIDLHGHTLDTAHQRLNHALATAVTHGHRVLLVVTGNPRPSHRGRWGTRRAGQFARKSVTGWHCPAMQMLSPACAPLTHATVARGRFMSSCDGRVDQGGYTIALKLRLVASNSL